MRIIVAIIIVVVVIFIIIHFSWSNVSSINGDSNLSKISVRETDSEMQLCFFTQHFRQSFRFPWTFAIAEEETVMRNIWINHISESYDISQINCKHHADSVGKETWYPLISEIKQSIATFGTSIIAIDLWYDPTKSTCPSSR